MESNLRLVAESILNYKAPATRKKLPAKTGDAEKQRMLTKLKKLRARRRGEALNLVEPLHTALDFHRSRATWRILDGSNRSAKTFHAAIEIARAICGQDPHEKYPRRDGFGIFVGLDGDHLASPMYNKLMEPGSFSLIPDEHTGKLRTVRPDPSNPLRLLPYDEAYREKWRQAPPLVPDRLIKFIAWEHKAKKIPRLLKLKNGWEILWRSSKGDPPRGRVFHLAWIDEQILNEQFYYEIARGFVDVSGVGIWSATAQTTNIQLTDLREKAEDEESKTVHAWKLYIDENPYLSDEQRHIFWESLSEDERETRYSGKHALVGRYVYAIFDPMSVHGCEPFEIPDEYTRYIFVDPGTQRCGTLFGAVDPEEKHLYIYDGFLLKHTDANGWASNVQRRQGKYRFEAVVCDKNAGRQTPMGFEDTVAKRYMDSLASVGVRPRSFGPMDGAYPGSNNINNRTEAVLDYMRIRNEDGVRGTAKLQVFRGTLPLLERQIKRAHTMGKTRDPDKRNEDMEQDMLHPLEYGVSFKPYYHTPEHIVDEDSNPVYDAFIAKRKRTNHYSEGIVLG